MDGLSWSQVWDILVTGFWPMLQAGIEVTVPLTLITFFLGLVLALITAIIRLSGFTPLVLLVKFYVWIFRGTPLLVQLYVIFWGLPSIGITIPQFTAAVIGFSLNVGAYSSETIRAAILSVAKGQWEAAYSLGMTRGQALRRVILPQAARVAVPPLSNTFISLVKDTSLAAVITVPEMFQKSQERAAANYEPLIDYVEVGFIYLVFSTVLSYAQAKLEKRLDKRVAS